MQTTCHQTLQTVDRLRIRFWLTQSVLLIALWGILTEGISQSPLLVSLTAFLSLSMVFPPIAGWLPRKWMLPFSLLLISAVAFDIARHWQQLLEPILRAGYLILWTRTIFYRTSRESMQLLLLALFLIMLTGVISVSISYVVQLMLFTPIAMVLLMLNTTRDPEQRDSLQHADWLQFNIRSFVSRLQASMSWRLLGLVGLSSLFMVISIAAIFIILPRFHFRQMMPSLTIPGIAKSGFSEAFSLGSVNRIMEDATVAFRVEIPQPSALPEIPYWRMLSLDVYQNGKFSRSSKAARRLRSPELMTSGHFVSNRMIQRPDFFSGEDWTFYLEGSISRYLPTPGTFRSIQFQSLQFLREDPIFATFNTRQTSSQLTTFRLRNVVADEPFRPSSMDSLLEQMRWSVISPGDALAIDTISYPASTLTAILEEKDAAYLQSIVDLLHSPPDSSFSAKAVDPIHTYITNVLQYLHQHHSYSLSSDVRTGGSNSRDPVIAWLQTQSPGHCEYFAAAAVLLFRANNIPARIATGFVGGEWNRTQNTFVVRNLNAHAWCEYYTEAGGWVRIDPTPATRLQLNWENLAGDASLRFSGWLGWLENVKLNYYRTIVGFDEASQYAMINQIGMRLQSANLEFLQLGRLSKALTQWFSGEVADEDQVNGNPQKHSYIPLAIGFGLLLTASSLICYYIVRHRNRRGSSSQTTRTSPRELRYRKKAGHWLKRVEMTDGFLSNHESTHLQLLRIRFGPIHSWDDPDTVFKEIREQMKRIHKKTRPQLDEQ